MGSFGAKKERSVHHDTVRFEKNGSMKEELLIGWDEEKYGDWLTIIIRSLVSIYVDLFGRLDYL